MVDSWGQREYLCGIYLHSTPLASRSMIQIKYAEPLKTSSNTVPGSVMRPGVLSLS